MESLDGSLLATHDGHFVLEVEWEGGPLLDDLVRHVIEVLVPLTFLDLAEVLAVE